MNLAYQALPTNFKFEFDFIDTLNLEHKSNENIVQLLRKFLIKTYVKSSFKNAISIVCEGIYGILCLPEMQEFEQMSKKQ